MYNINKIKERKEKLLLLKIALKAKFVGLDDIIDKIVYNIEVWYLMPELLTRPVIVNLWGLTGVGKTDLVRTLVCELDFTEKFVEVQLDTGTETNGWSNINSIKHEMNLVGLKEVDMGILLLDEIQRFRSKDELGKVINNSKYQDIWMLLSDGKLNTKDFRKNALQNLLIELYYFKDLDKDEEDNDSGSNNEEDITESPNLKKNKKGKKFKMGMWAAKELKSVLEIDTPLNKIMKWGFRKKVQKINKKIKQVDSVNELDKKYSKLLIFISGNIDKAYSMSNKISDTSIDADIFNEFSKKINVIKIKEALSLSFLPEQIARFGNIHVIYPSLSKKNYCDLIELKLNEIINKTKETFDIKISYDQLVKDALYRNGVYPSQGVRPLFSSIGSIIENSIPLFLMETIFSNSKKIDITIDGDKSLMVGKITLKNSVKVIKRQITLDLDVIKKELNENIYYQICVHEAGHAVVYALLFKVAPSQVVGDSINNESDGFVIPHSFSQDKNNIEHNIKILLAGTVAEEIVFGANYKGSGSSGDIISATSLASAMLRNCNMGDTVSFIVDETYSEAYKYNTNIENSNLGIEKILKTQKEQATKLLLDNKQYFYEILRKLISNKRLFPDEFFKIGKKYDSDLKLVENSHLIVHDYKKRVIDFNKYGI